ncbi:MAG TPA: hypothetical protein CFH81_01935 [Sulfurovum sp. UBA12169]|nr:MAG TPA: hypothetical protein CFH81_01935 [Sulfurovum sp. UBA12169]
MKKILKNIRFKLLFWLGIFLSAIFIIFGFVLTNSLQNSYHQSIESTLTMAMKDLVYEYDDKHFKHGINEVKNEFGIETLYIQILKISNGTSSILERSDDLKSHSLGYKEIDIKGFKKDEIYFFTQQDSALTDANIKVAAAILDDSDSEMIIVQCAMPYDAYSAHIKNSVLMLLIGLPLLLIIILIATNIIISKSLMQTKIVLDEVKNIEVDHFSFNIQKTHVAKEIDELIETFNNLIRKIQQSYKRVREFGHNASHELKTPLTIIKGEVDVGLRKERSVEEYKNILKIVQSEALHLQDTIEKILFLSNTDENIIKDSFTVISMDTIVGEVVEEKRLLAKNKNIYIELLDLKEVPMSGNAAFLKIVISNLLENAIKYSHTDTKIEVSLTKDGLVIKDFGLGIPQNEIEHIFDRFYRVDKVRSNASGSGLGLSIIKTILDIHNFKISIQSVENQYTAVTITFHT